jgi:lipoic acid synthetase
VQKLLRQHGLNTVCEQARCPNKAECWGSGTATFLLMGDRCTRSCRFCSVSQADAALAPPDPAEAQGVLEAAKLLGLRHVVLTSVTRDDLSDGGAAHYASVIELIHEKLDAVTVEVLIPPLGTEGLRTVVRAGPEVIAHNVEVVRRLTPEVRDPRADYDASLGVLRQLRGLHPAVRIKSSLMLGFGETRAEILECLDDLRAAGVDIVAIGQYLQPTPGQVPVAEYVTPEQFDEIREQALIRRFTHVAAGPFVRTSFRAHEAVKPPVPVPEIAYQDAMALMQKAQRELIRGGPESVIVLSHPPVITLGRQADPSHVRSSQEVLEEAGIEVVRTTRGGEVTYHGPGQVVVYPVLDIGRRKMGTRAYVTALLECTRRALVGLGVAAVLNPDLIGVFVEDNQGPPAKIAALGVSVSRGITGHGVAVNVTTVPAQFAHIVPCGLTDVRVASLGRFIDPVPSAETVATRLVAELADRFGRDLRLLP